LVLSFVISLVRDISYWDRPGWRAKGSFATCRHSLHRLNASMIKQKENNEVNGRANLRSYIHTSNPLLCVSGSALDHTVILGEGNASERGGAGAGELGETRARRRWRRNEEPSRYVCMYVCSCFLGSYLAIGMPGELGHRYRLPTRWTEWWLNRVQHDLSQREDGPMRPARSPLIPPSREAVEMEWNGRK